VAQPVPAEVLDVNLQTLAELQDVTTPVIGGGDAGRRDHGHQEQIDGTEPSQTSCAHEHGRGEGAKKAPLATGESTLRRAVQLEERSWRKERPKLDSGLKGRFGCLTPVGPHERDPECAGCPWQHSRFG
jgi:hypothetical protein